MRSRPALLLIAAMYTIAWFLPVHNVFDHGYEAFVTLWSGIFRMGSDVLKEPLSILMALGPHTNYAVPVTFYLLLHGGVSPIVLRRLVWVLSVCVASDAYYLSLGSELRVGYFLWLATFIYLLIAVVLFWRETRSTPAPSRSAA